MWLCVLSPLESTEYKVLLGVASTFLPHTCSCRRLLYRNTTGSHGNHNRLLYFHGMIAIHMVQTSLVLELYRCLICHQCSVD